jgi:hypothetical protein
MMSEFSGPCGGETFHPPQTQHANPNLRATRPPASVAMTIHMMRQQRLTRAQWDREVTKMTGWGAGVKPEQHNGLLDYLAARYKP